MKSNYIIYYIILSFVFVAANCTGVETTTRGLESEAYLEFVGSGYSSGIEVIIDSENRFNAEVKSKVAKRPSGNIYAIEPGRHLLEIYHNNSLIFKKEIFVSTQETYRVNLP